MNTIRRSLLWPLLLAATLLCSLASAQSEDAEAAKTQVLKLFKVLRSKDWKALYDLTAFSPAVSKVLMNRDVFAEGFAKGLKDGDPDDAFGKLVAGMDGVIVGFGIVDKSGATVATSCKVSLNGAAPVTFLGIAKLIKVEGVWKWDLSFTDDTQKSMEQRFTELLGVPAKG